jgi:hypothetical protein
VDLSDQDLEAVAGGDIRGTDYTGDPVTCDHGTECFEIIDE